MKSFLQAFQYQRTNVKMICRRRVNSEGHFQQHRSLHNLAKVFALFNTNALILKGEMRKNTSDTEGKARSNAHA